MRVLVAMSGGVDSSVAAALVQQAGHETVGATLKLWGGASDSGCCSVADVDDARRVARHLGMDHHVFNLTDLFQQHVVDPYVDGHARGLTPNPCIECNRHVKFGALLDRAQRLGFDALATGHHARVDRTGGPARLRRGADDTKDQSYVLSMLGAGQLESLMLPVGDMLKSQVRALAGELGLRTAAKADSQDVCFIHSGSGRQGFLGDRLSLHGGTVVDAASGFTIGTVPAVEMVTVGQRRGLGVGLDGQRRYALSVDVPRRTVTVGEWDHALTGTLTVGPWTWVDDVPSSGFKAVAQCSAHGRPALCTVEHSPWGGTVVFDEPQRLVAPGQTVAVYDEATGDFVMGSAVVVAT